MSSKGTILIVDDNADSLKLLAKILWEEGYEVRPANSGALALASIDINPPDLILLDIRMPEMDGYEVRRRLQACNQTRDIPVIFISGVQNAEEWVQCLRLGAVDFISKPYLREELLARVDTHLTLRRMQLNLEQRVEERTAELVEANQKLKEQIHQREAVQEVLRRNNNILRTQQETSLDGILIMNEQEQIISFNQRLLQLWGLPADLPREGSAAKVLEVIAKQVAAPADFLSRTRRLFEDRKQTKQDELILLDGRIVERYSAPIWDSERYYGRISYYRDITERRQREQEMRRARDEAEAASRAKDQFLALLSHELRTPLTPLQSGLDVLEGGASDRPQETLKMMRRNLVLESRLIDDLLDLTRISRGKLSMRLGIADVHRVIRDALEVYRVQVSDRDVELRLEAEQHWAKADAVRLQQVFRRIIENAVRFSFPGGRIEISTNNNVAGSIQIRFADNGVGIDPGDLARIFGSFEQSDRKMESGYGGLGIGLAISKALVEAQGGKIKAYSAGRGAGAAFEIILPIVPCNVDGSDTSALSHPSVTDEPQTSADRKSLRILLVEDHTDTRQLLKQLLARAGYSVETAKDVRSARERAAASKFNLFISDIGLPDGSGLDLVQIVHQLQPIPAIALSGFGAESDMQRSREAGFDEYLVKPVEFKRLRDSIERLSADDAEKSPAR